MRGVQVVLSATSAYRNAVGDLDRSLANVAKLRKFKESPIIISRKSPM